MKRGVIVSLAVISAGAVSALGQIPRSGAVLVTEEVTPPPSVIRLNSPYSQRPAPQKPKPKPPAPVEQQPTPQAPPPPVNQQATASQPANQQPAPAAPTIQPTATAALAIQQTASAAPAIQQPATAASLSQQPVQPAVYIQDAQAMEPIRPVLATMQAPVEPPPPAPKVETPKVEPKLETPKVEAPIVEPLKTEPPPEMLPLPKDSPIPAVVDEGHIQRNDYETTTFSPLFPWTKCGRKTCGTVFMQEPYYWFDARYLFGWFKKDHTQALVTTGPVGSAVPGALTDPRTTVLYDGQNMHDMPYMGGQFSLGGWFDECQYCGGELNYFFFASQDKGFIAAANGFPGLPGLYRPFFNPLTGAEDAFPSAEPGNSSGIIRINSRSELNGADGHFLFSFARKMSFRSDALAGVRYLGLAEELVIEENVRQFARPNRLPNDIGILDRFSTRTDFIGGDFGFKSRWVNECWSFDLLTRVAIGGNHQIIRGDGLTGFTPFGIPTAILQGGRLVGPANVGVFGNDVFSVVPEIGLTLGYQPVHWFKFTVGYNWMYWTNVVRPGAQVDRVVNPIGVPVSPQFHSTIYEPQRPGVGYNQNDIWLQAVTVGMQFTF